MGKQQTFEYDGETFTIIHDIKSFTIKCDNTEALTRFYLEIYNKDPSVLASHKEDTENSIVLLPSNWDTVNAFLSKTDDSGPTMAP
jgi:hypothetical protein